jgi:hypothetical protein
MGRDRCLSGGAVESTFRLKRENGITLSQRVRKEIFVISHDSTVGLRRTLVNDLPDQHGGTMMF